ncbi:MAG: TPR repeat [Verrucomicrobia bacterium]|nr:MAG: TPR repeat [Verrucomicrobiota bacterium]
MSMFARTTLLILLSLGFVCLVAADSDELNLLRSKAEHGNALAQYNLGLVYAQGRLAPADPAEAFAWLSIASENGATGKALDSLLGNITDQQLAEGRRRLGVYRTALASANTTVTSHPTPKLAPRGFTVDPTPVTPPAADPSTPLTKAPEVVAPPATTTPAGGSGMTELAQTRKDLEQSRAELLAANTELTALRAAVARLTEELAAAKRTRATLKPGADLTPAEKSQTEDSARTRP